MSRLAIKAENLSKAYQLGEFSTGTISRDVERWWYRMRGKEDPFLKIGETNDRTVKGTSDVVWSLKDINFEIKQGEAVGIIGRNGAGKSTLLKLLSRVTAPTSGQVKVKGRIASLLEVGTGFHPELTGRENIYLNGAILGMRKQEIKRKFDEIVDFAGVERYIETPVKRYSSGMYVRLAFAVAAHLESEILIVDEVLAVGDAEFQKKCLGKMGEVSKGEGRTVLFVSHNMGSIKTLCAKGLVLKYGMIDFFGTTEKAVVHYLNEHTTKNVFYKNIAPNADSDLLELKVVNSFDELTERFGFEQEVGILMKVRVAEKHRTAMIGVRIRDQFERNVFTSQIRVDEHIKTPGEFTLKMTIPIGVLVPNKYEIIFGFHVVNSEILHLSDCAVSFQIEETGTKFYLYEGNDYGCIFLNCHWRVLA